MSHIKNIEIKNFKSIRHAKIEDCRRVNVFIGYPNVGKSNILEAMSLISYLKRRNNEPLKNFIRYKELIDIFNDGDKQKDAEVIIDQYAFSLQIVNKNDLDFTIIDRFFYTEGFNRVLANVLRNLTVNKNGSIGGGTRDYDDSIIDLKKYEFRATHDSNNSNPKVLNFPYGNNLPEVIRYNSQLRKECGELFADYNLKLIFDENGIVVQKQLDEFSAFQFSFSQIADTLQRLIFHKAAIATNEESILLFEEPEAHMFPPYISKLTSDICFDGNNNQYFITTHSPFVINDFIENLKKRNELSIYVVGYKKETGETGIRMLNDSEMHEIHQFGIDLYMNLENYLPHEQ